MISKFVLLKLFCVFFHAANARNHIYRISGKLYTTTDGLYNYAPLAGSRFDLYDKDHGVFNKDDHMGQAETDAQGNFKIIGSEDEDETPEPYLYFYTVNYYNL